MAETFTITELSGAFDITPRTIRFYEDKGLLSPERNGTNRIYSRRDRARLDLILRGKRLGFSLADINEMLDLYGTDDGHVEQMQVTWQKCQARLAELRGQRLDLDATIGELDAICDKIEQRLQQTGAAPPSNLTTCAVTRHVNGKDQAVE